VLYRLLLASCLWAAPFFAQELQFADLGDFRLENGASIRNCRVGYRTFGKLNAGKSNAVVFLPGLRERRRISSN
jgi:homoserine O-acetyltransferase